MVSDNTYSKSNASPLGSKEGKLHAMSASESLYFHIYAIKEQNPTWQIEAKTVKTPNGKDYIYKLTNRDEILENINKN